MMCPICGETMDENDHCDYCELDLEDMSEYFSDGENEFIRILISNHRCPECCTILDEDDYCDNCNMYLDEICENLNYDDEDIFESDDVDYESLINNGDAICLNCTYWSVSPYGSSHGMICRKGYSSEGPDDSCDSFVKSIHFASYGEEGQYQFNETRRKIANKLHYWKNSR